MRATRIALMLFTSVFLAQWQTARSSSSDGGNTTTTTSSDPSDDEELDEALENMDLAEFKERYRRLIQYRTYYVASNYLNSQVLGAVNQQHPPQQQQQQQHQQHQQHQQQHSGYDRETAQPTNPLIRKPQRLIPLGRPIDPASVVVSRRKPIGRPSNGPGRHKQADKFVPSVQYDPKEIGGEAADYFTPLKHTAAKFNYDQADYGTNQYERVQPSRVFSRPEVAGALRPEVTSPLQQQLGYYAKSRAPTRTADNLHLRKYIPTRAKAPAQLPAPPPPPHATQHQDYLLDYGTRTGNNKAPFHGSDYNYQAEDYEPVRLNIESPPRIYQKPTRILAQSRPSSPYSFPLHLAHNPSVNLHDIMKSLQLTNRLPEMLNQDNIDSSIRTLVEILSILNNAKNADLPHLPATNQPRNPVPSYKQQKPNYTRPKVVTETRFQATPQPPIVRDENRYEIGTSHERPSVNYIAENPRQQSVEYYTPIVQDIEPDEPSVERYRPTEEAPTIDENTEHRYEITEDLADDILEPEKFAQPPTTTETPIGKFQLPDGVSTHTQLVPPTTLKYGATRGKPNVDYPAYAAIPQTEFNCKEQRYKGFFGDPSTGCQVWHYCDLNGGKSSFLCPNGTIFSQVALTCDWWFNVHCESTTQLYVLNERLYKYILPIMPKFPEDFSGPEVDRYLELKFKEMEAKLKEKKLKKQQEKDKVKEKLQALETEE